MASINLNGKTLMQNSVLVIDTTKLMREAFGVGQWRLKLARVLMLAAARLLRCGVEVV